MAGALDDYRNLDIREIGVWPFPAKAAILLVIFLVLNVAAYFLVWNDQLTERDNELQKESQLKDEFLEKKRKAVNLDAYVQQLKEIRQSLSELLKQLPKKSEMDALLTDINQAGVGRGLEFQLFRPAASETKTQEMAELPIELKVRGNYHSFAHFAADIAQLPRIVILNDVEVATDKDGLLSLSAVAKTFRYLDEQELADAKQAAKPGQPK